MFKSTNKIQSTILSAIISGIVLIAIFPDTTKGLSPIYYETPQEWREQSDAVFSGIIMESKTIREEPDLDLAVVSVSIQVNRIWKGKITDHTNVRHHGLPYSPYKGEELLFYATGDQNTLSVPVGGIFRTEPGQEGAEHTEALGPGAYKDTVVTALEPLYVSTTEPTPPTPVRSHPSPSPEIEHPTQESPLPSLISEHEYESHLTLFNFFKILLSPTQTFRIMVFMLSHSFGLNTNSIVYNQEPSPVSRPPISSPPTQIDLSPAPKKTPATPQKPSQREFESLAHHDSAWDQLPRENHVIRDAKRWEEFWNEVYRERNPVPELPSVDFNTTMVIAAVMGNQTTGGYTIEIVNILEKEHSIEISIRESSPDPDVDVTQAITNPVHIVTTNQTEKDIVFVR